MAQTGLTRKEDENMGLIEINMNQGMAYIPESIRALLNIPTRGTIYATLGKRGGGLILTATKPTGDLAE
jgi:hypothetical protein